MPVARQLTLQIASRAAGDLGLFGGFSSLASGTTETAMLLRAMNETARDAYTGGLLIREHTFYTADGQASYPLPSDYFLPWTGTTWNRTDQWSMRHAGRTEWQANKSGFTASTVHQRYHIMPATGTGVYGAAVDASDQYTLRRLHIDPVPSSAERIAFNYRSDHWCEGSLSGTGVITGVTLSGTDEVVVTVTAAHSKSAGDVFAFVGVGGTTELNHNTYTASAVGSDTITLMGTNSADFTAWTAGGNAVFLTDLPEDGTGTYSLVPEDLMDRGVVYRLRRRMGMSYLDHKLEYDDLLAAYIGQHGEHRVNIGGEQVGNYPGIPEGNFPAS
ncbi:MAG: hypothetical protein OEQ74_05220 [Gammaproteobacteria bacterium]|nr:hypothetical protein [Gammaproteobacteria bacterium]